METVLNKIAELEDKILCMTATMEEEVLYHKLIYAVEDFQNKNK